MRYVVEIESESGCSYFESKYKDSIDKELELIPILYGSSIIKLEVRVDNKVVYSVVANANNNQA